jgi:hypothetical protein|tara:strand:+ start:384 stop:530 length:147 start_codon:yes stop_codon:yes gene_type:complete
MGDETLRKELGKQLELDGKPRSLESKSPRQQMARKLKAFFRLRISQKI